MVAALRLCIEFAVYDGLLIPRALDFIEVDGSYPWGWKMNMCCESFYRKAPGMGKKVLDCKNMPPSSSKLSQLPLIISLMTQALLSGENCFLSWESLVP